MIGDSRPALAAKLKKIIRQIIPMKVIIPFFNAFVWWKATRLGYSITSNDAFYKISKGKKELRLSRMHAIYLKDTIEHFDFFYSGVEPIEVNGVSLVDYSTPRWHKVKNFDLFPVFFPSVSEPVITTEQYIQFAKLCPDAVAIDLGAYAGLTSILFDMAIPSGGRVVAVEPDIHNISACEQNIALYRSFSKRTIHLFKGAVWSDDKGIAFSSEGNMGSSAAAISGTDRGEVTIVPSLTLDQLAELLKLPRVDFIKCDIEGGEAEIFDCPMFFAKYSPSIMVECHLVEGISTAASVAATLGKFGYVCEVVPQRGFPLPLLACRRRP
jgi:FkbM family methyltransferase